MTAVENGYTTKAMREVSNLTSLCIWTMDVPLDLQKWCGEKNKVDVY